MRYIKGYRIVDVPLTENGGVMHSVFLKEHADRTKKESNGKILFVGNVDYRFNMTPTIIDEYLRLLLSRFGDISSISVSSFSEDVDEKAKTRFAHVEFVKKSTLKLVLNTSDTEYAEAGSEVQKQFGMNKLVQVKNSGDIRAMFPFVDEDPEELLADVNSFMSEFEEGEAAAKLEKENALNQVDEDGFMPAKNRNKRKRVVEERRGSTHARPRSEKKKLELTNFYRFQIREDKMKQLDTLRQKFDQDKERVAKMKEARKFKPF